MLSFHDGSAVALRLGARAPLPADKPRLPFFQTFLTTLIMCFATLRMNTRISCFLKLAAPLLLWSGSSAATASAADTATLFTHVNVVPMDRERVLPNQSVLVEGGRIKAIGAGLLAAADVREIDGHGTQFLSPGLADMHEHSDTSRDMAVFLANGVTTVLNMGEARNSFMAQTRPKVNSGEIPDRTSTRAFWSMVRRSLVISQ